MMSGSNTNKETVVIAGAASGIGRECLELFARRHHRVIGLDIDAAALAAIKCDSYPIQPELRTIDLVSGGHVSLETLGVKFHPDEIVSLIQCIGGSFTHADAQDAGRLDWMLFERAYALNMKPVVQLLNMCLPHMRSCRKGYVVTISSIAARCPMDMVHPSYPAAKAAVLGFSRQLASELAEGNILVNTVCPGIIDTPRISARWSSRSEAENQRILDRIPLGRLGSPDAVAKLIYFLSTSENSYMTGAVVDINGGLFEA